MLKKLIVILFVLCGFVSSTKAQNMSDVEKEALLLLSQKDYGKALPMLHQLFTNAPYDKKYYDNYYAALIEVKSYDTAIALGQYMSKIRKEDLTVWVDIGQAYQLKGDKKNATKYFDEAIDAQNGNEYQTTGLASAFRFIKNEDYELKAFETFQKKIGNPYAFAYEMALLYDKRGNTDKAIEMLVSALSMQPFGLENAKQTLERVIENQPKKMKKAEAAVAKKLKEEPNSYLWKELFTWMQSSKGDKSEQLSEIIKLDEQQNQRGNIVLGWVKEQYQKEEWEAALQGLQYLIKLPVENPIRPNATLLYLDIQQQKLERTFPVVPAQVQSILNDYKQFFAEYPNLKNTKAILGYANVMALFADQAQQAFDTLDAVIQLPYMPPNLVGEAKLNMGDYQVLLGNVWQAALLYSQVDKTFKEDQLGEEARFRNAKLSYFRGDFEYAQGQLSVLKASTSEFIANDALYLSVLITENTPEDKGFDALKVFSRAGLMQFQHKYNEADQLLDSLSKAFPEDELQDDIHLQRANIATKKQEYDKAVAFLNVILEKYADDVLADDATMRLAEIYEHQYKDKAKAKAAYEKLIVDHPGSSFVQQARARYEALSKTGT